VVRGAAAQAADQGAVDVGLKLALQAAHLAGTEVEQARRLGLGALAREHAIQDFKDIPFLLTHRDPVGGKHPDSHGSSWLGARRTFLLR
jgi:hypothetical protein